MSCECFLVLLKGFIFHLILISFMQAPDFYLEMKWEFTSWGKKKKLNI